MSFSIELSRLYYRDLTRLIQELEAFPNDESLWQTLPGVTNSAGNLALHLEGNLREFIGRLIGGLAFERKRDLEFSTKNLTRKELTGRIDSVRSVVPGVVAAMTSGLLEASYPQLMAGSVMTHQQALMHTYGHLSYHLGQIDYLRRTLTGAGSIELASL